MDESLIIPLALVLMVVVVILLLWTSINRGRKNDRVWREIASRTQLNYTPIESTLLGLPIPGWIDGSYRGRRISLARIVDKKSEWSDEYTKVWVEVNGPIDGKLTLSPKSLLGSKGIETGVEEIDDRFIVNSDPIEFASHIFASTYLCNELQEGPSIDFVISGVKGGIESINRAEPNETDYWLSVIDLLCDVADAFEGKGLPSNSASERR